MQNHLLRPSFTRRAGTVKKNSLKPPQGKLKAISISEKKRNKNIFLNILPGKIN